MSWRSEESERKIHRLVASRLVFASLQLTFTNEEQTREKTLGQGLIKQGVMVVFSQNKVYFPSNVRVSVHFHRIKAGLELRDVAYRSVNIS